MAVIAQRVYVWQTGPSKVCSRIAMRAGPFVIAAILFKASAAFAGEPMAPSDIKATFFNGQPFTATAPTGVKFTMTFTPDGKMKREALAPSGKTSVGTWKLNAKGFCTSWEHAKTNCFTVIPNGENKWAVQQIATTIAITIAAWSK
jgi:hypothetical protein